jgi:excinuclease ABC subunit B
MYDIRMIQETWYVNGIENYSPYFEWRLNGEPPNTLFDYFPDDFLLIIDESHMTIPQLRAMPQWDKSRKTNLIEHGFRLPSAIHHRPLIFEELETILGWNTPQTEDQWQLLENKVRKFFSWYLGDNYIDKLKEKIKKNCKTLFVSATPAEYELKISEKIVEQIIRPTGLLDPITYVYPKSWDYKILLDSLEKLLKKKPELKKYLKGYNQNIDLKEVFLD